MPPRGLTLRTMNRFAGRHLRDDVKIERLSGIVDDIASYEDLGHFNGKYVEKSSSSYLPNGVDQRYDGTVIIRSGVVFSEPNDRYRITVAQLKSAVELDGDDVSVPEVKRERIFELVGVDVLQDSDGTDFLQVLRIKNGDLSS